MSITSFKYLSFIINIITKTSWVLEAKFNYLTLKKMKNVKNKCHLLPSYLPIAIIPSNNELSFVLLSSLVSLSQIPSPKPPGSLVLVHAPRYYIAHFSYQVHGLGITVFFLEIANISYCTAVFTMIKSWHWKEL